MAQITKMVDVPASRREVVEKHVCDLCGKEARSSSNWHDTSQYDVNETEIKMRAGTSCPEGGNIETTEFDICDDCFKSKLMPWLEAQGATPRTSESDW